MVPLPDGAADPLGTWLFPGVLSAMVKSPPDFPSDKPNKLNFFRLVDQFTSERRNAATWIFFFPVQRVSWMSCRSESNAEWKKDQELCQSPHTSARALRWVPKPTCGSKILLHSRQMEEKHPLCLTFWPEQEEQRESSVSENHSWEGRE